MINGMTKNDYTMLWNFFKIFIKDKYLGSKIGFIWAFIQPLILFIIFTFVFGFMFKTRIPGVEGTLSYAIWLIIGYGPWLAISESIIASSASIVSSAGLIKNIHFKIELLPLAAVFTGLLPLFISFIFVIILMIMNNDYPSSFIFFTPIVLLVHYMFLMSISLILSLINVFFRDLSFALPNILLIILFGSPIFYSVESVPVILQKVSVFNPFFIITEGYRDCFVNKEYPNFISLLVLFIFSILFFQFSLRGFRRVSPHFGSQL